MIVVLMGVLAAEPTFATRLEPAEAAIAEPVTLTLEWSAPEGWAVEPPVLAERYGDLVRVSAGGRSAVYEAYDAGVQAVPPLACVFAGPGGERVALESGRLEVQVRSAVSPWRAASDLEPLVRLPWTWGQRAAAAGVVLAIVAAAVGAARWAKSSARRRRRLVRRLTALERRAAAEPDRVAAEAAAVLRAMAGAEGRTSEELAAGGLPTSWTPRDRADAAALLVEADAARFGGRPADAAVVTAGVRALRRAADGGPTHSRGPATGGA